MKKSLPYILIGLIGVAVILLLVTGGSGKSRPRERRLDERVTFRKRDKIPYGAFVAYENLKNIFPDAALQMTRAEPGAWDSLSEYDKEQALIILTPEFMADDYEMKNLLSFIENGNDVFISTMSLSYDVTEMLNCEVNSTENLISFFSESEAFDSLTVSLARPPFDSLLSYTYPGKSYDGYFSQVDTTTTTVLGYDEAGHPNFVHLKAGDGNLYVHLAPMAFTNYFLLHKNNMSYYEKAFSVLSPATRKIAWDEYYLSGRSGKSRRGDNQSSNWLSSLFHYPALSAALLVLLSTLLLYVLMEMRRKQRFIPVIKQPKNDSLDFVKTIGRLYHDKGDHVNLCRKMAAYFLEHVRTRYGLPTNELNDEFVKALHNKTGVEEAEIAGIVSYIRELGHLGSVSEKRLAAFHHQLESFYKKA